LGISSSLMRPSSATSRCSISTASAAISRSSAAISRAASRSACTASCSRIAATSGPSSAYRRPSSRRTPWSPCTDGSASCASRSAYSDSALSVGCRSPRSCWAPARSCSRRWCGSCPGHGSGARPRVGERAPQGRYLERLPKRCSNRATRPPVSRIFCLPV
jgi:hypothetical protein